MQSHTLRGIFIIGAVALALSGCGQKPLGGAVSQGSEPPAASSTNSQANPPSVSKDTTPSNDKDKQAIHSTIKAYYGDEQQTQVVEKQVSISYKDDKDKYTTALWTLKKAPENSKLVPLAEALGFKSAVLKDHKLTVDVTVSGEGRLGAPGEQMLLEALKKTCFQFPEVETIDILVDGKPADSLMGHMELPHPIKR